MDRLYKEEKDDNNVVLSDKEASSKSGGSIRKGVICAVLGAVSWGLSGTLSQYMFMNYELDSSWLTTMRMTASGIVLLLLSLVTERNALWGIVSHRRDLIHEIIFGIAGLMFCQFAYLSAIQHSNSATATVLQNLSVPLIAVFTAIITGKLPKKRQVFSIILALLGVFLIATHGNPSSMVISKKGLMWGLGAALGVITYSMLSAGLVAKWGSRAVSAYGMLIGGVILGGLTGSFGMRPALDVYGYIVMGLIVLIGTVGAFTLFLEGIHELGAVRATIIGCLEPVTATIVSALWLGSVFTLPDILGFVCILATVIIFNTGDGSDASGDEGSQK